MDKATAHEIVKKMIGEEADIPAKAFLDKLLMVDHYSRNLPIIKKVYEEAKEDFETSLVYSSQENPASSQISEEYLIELITPWVEQTREKFFGSRSAPFKTFEKAEVWIYKSYELEKKEYELLKKELEYRRLMSVALSIKLGQTEPEYNWYAALLAEKCTLEELAAVWRKTVKESPVTSYEVAKPIVSQCVDEAESMARATGFKMYQMLMYILTDIKTPLFRIWTNVHKEVHKLPSGESIVNSYATLTLRGEVTSSELSSAYKEIRKQLGITKKKDFNEKHLTIYQMVQSKKVDKLGVSFWKAIQSEWNKTHPRHKYKTWKGVKIAYDRICQKFQNRYLRKCKTGKGEGK